MARAVTVIPATLNLFTNTSILTPIRRKTAGYARVSTDNEEQLSSYEKVYVYEEAYFVGSIGQYIAAQLAQVGFKGKLKITAINGFVKQGTVDELLKDNLLNAQAIFDAVRKDDSLESK